MQTQIVSKLSMHIGKNDLVSETSTTMWYDRPGKLVKSSENLIIMLRLQSVQ